MKIALVHDYLREYGGAERVVEALHELWPDAPLYTSFIDWKALGNQAERFRGWDIRTSWVQHNWFVRKFHSPLRFLARNIWESLDLSGYDVVITSSGWYISRGILVKPPAVHICYIHHPPRNLYGYATGSDIQKYALVRAYSTVVNFFLRHYDFETAQRVDYFVANSEETARRVRKFYRRESTVIYPPVEIQRLKNAESGITNKEQKGNYYLSVGRLSWAKRIDLIITACNELRLPLKVVGKGKEEGYLRSIAGPTIAFVGGISDDELASLYRGAKALIFAAMDEDFGIVPVEAMGYGTPVIALAQGGVLETVVDKKTGIYFSDPTKESLVAAIGKFNAMHLDWSRNCLAQAQNFTKDKFQKTMRAYVEKHARAGPRKQSSQETSYRV